MLITAKRNQTDGAMVELSYYERGFGRLLAGIVHEDSLSQLEIGDDLDSGPVELEINRRGE